MEVGDRVRIKSGYLFAGKIGIVAILYRYGEKRFADINFINQPSLRREIPFFTHKLEVINKPKLKLKRFALWK